MKKTLLLFSVLINYFFAFSQTQNTFVPGDTLGPWYTINFDNALNYIQIDTSVQNIWQIGTPQKILFNSAYSQTHAIVTDTLNNYPVNNHSYFDLSVGNFNFYGYYPYDIYFDFWHKFNTDTLKDGGYITVSWDNGQTWKNIIEDTILGMFSPAFFPFQTNLYTSTNTLYNGEYGFSGGSNGWIHTSFAWQTIIVKNFPPDTMILRFNFISDSISNLKEGWMIDNIKLFSIDLAGGIHDLINNSNFVNVFPNPFNSEAEIALDKSYKTIDIDVCDIQGKLIEQKEYLNCNKIHFNRNGLENGLYFFKVKLDRKIIEIKKVIITD